MKKLRHAILKSFFKSGTPAKNDLNAFSLVEVVLALGIISFSVVLILGLFPVGLKSAQESRIETRASYLAGQIIDDLRSSPFNAAAILYRENGALETLPSVDLTTSTTFALGCDDNDNVIMQVPAADYEDGSNATGVKYLAQVSIATPPADFSAFPNLAQVIVEISYPATAQKTNRTRYVFFTLIGQKQELSQP
jgi:type II secretory pathway pseudopilin PulG